jgi:hypothetical protein
VHAAGSHTSEGLSARNEGVRLVVIPAILENRPRCPRTRRPGGVTPRCEQQAPRVASKTLADTHPGTAADDLIAHRPPLRRPPHPPTEHTVRMIEALRMRRRKVRGSSEVPKASDSSPCPGDPMRRPRAPAFSCFTWSPALQSPSQISIRVHAQTPLPLRSSRRDLFARPSLSDPVLPAKIGSHHPPAPQTSAD